MIVVCRVMNRRVNRWPHQIKVVLHSIGVGRRRASNLKIVVDDRTSLIDAQLHADIGVEPSWIWTEMRSFASAEEDERALLIACEDWHQ